MRRASPAPRLSLALLAAATTAGCLDPGTVELQGVVVDGWEASAPPIEGATVTTVDDDLETVDQTTSQAGGWFRLEAVTGARTRLRIDGEGLETTWFSGQSGAEARLRIPNGQVFALSETRWAEARQRWEGCPRLDLEGGILVGEIRVDGFEDPEVDGLLRVQTGRVVVQLGDGTALTACNLGEAGVYDPDAVTTGPTATFLVGGVPTGTHSLIVVWTPVDGLEREVVFDVFVEDGTIAPRFPLLVPFEPL
jgi:hypothetical protein